MIIDGDGFDSLEDIKKEFRITGAELEGVEILYANYTLGDYEGDAFVLFRKEGKLYEVNGGHCSCYGLEDQWEPEETTVEAIINRPHLRNCMDINKIKEALNVF